MAPGGRAQGPDSSWVLDEVLQGLVVRPPPCPRPHSRARRTHSQRLNCLGNIRKSIMNVYARGALMQVPSMAQSNPDHGNRWNPEDCGPLVKLSGENLVTAYRGRKSAGKNHLVRASVGWLSGVHYWEVALSEFSKSGSGYHSIGVAAADVPLRGAGMQLMGDCKTALAWALHLEKYTIIHRKVSSAAGFHELPASGQVIGVLLDLEVGTLTFFLNGVSTPDSVVRSPDLRLPRVPLYPAVEMGCLVKNRYTTNFSAPPPPGVVLLARVEGAETISASEPLVQALMESSGSREIRREAVPAAREILRATTSRESFIAAAKSAAAALAGMCGAEAAATGGGSGRGAGSAPSPPLRSATGAAVALREAFPVLALCGGLLDVDPPSEPELEALMLSGEALATPERDRAGRAFDRGPSGGDGRFLRAVLDLAEKTLEATEHQRQQYPCDEQAVAGPSAAGPGGLRGSGPTAAEQAARLENVALSALLTRIVRVCWALSRVPRMALAMASRPGLVARLAEVAAAPAGLPFTTGDAILAENALALCLPSSAAGSMKEEAGEAAAREPQTALPADAPAGAPRSDVFVGATPAGNPPLHWEGNDTQHSTVSNNSLAFEKTGDSEDPDYSAAKGSVVFAEGQHRWSVKVVSSVAKRIFLGVVEPEAFEADERDANVKSGVFWLNNDGVPRSQVSWVDTDDASIRLGTFAEGDELHFHLDLDAGTLTVQVSRPESVHTLAHCTCKMGPSCQSCAGKSATALVPWFNSSRHFAPFRAHCFVIRAPSLS